MGKLPFETIERDVIVLRESKPSQEHGFNPYNRPVEDLISYGIINVDKPKGPTSHQVSSYVQKILGIKKSGHSGTLDPAVTGVLPVALEKATRVVQALLHAGKEYVCIMNIHEAQSEYDIFKLCDQFVGVITQMPPVRSAVKRQLRERTIYYIDVLETSENGRNALFVVGCEAGTYIRKLVHDMGVAAGSAAHMQELRRTKAGPFNEEQLFTLQDITDAWHYYKEENNDSFIRQVIQPMEAAVAHLPQVWVLDSTINSVCHGANVCTPGLGKIHTEIQKDDTVAIMSLKGELIALGTATMSTNDMQQSEKGVCVRTDKVFMDRSLYPKYVK